MHLHVHCVMYVFSTRMAIATMQNMSEASIEKVAIRQIS
jgi:hypothetical protein